MKAHGLHCRQLFAAIVLLLCPLALVSAHPPLPVQQGNACGPDDPKLSNEEIKKFLLTAKIVNVKESKKGKTAPKRLTLSDGAVTYDASFQTIDEHNPVMKFANGQTELNSVDSYRYNIAAYGLAEMLGLEDIIPVYVERNWHGNTGSLSWWLPVQMDEADRLKQKIPVPESAADTWDKQMYKIRVFDALVYDNDPNLTNVLISQDWKPWRVDFSRAIRLSKDLRDPKDLKLSWRGATRSWRHSKSGSRKRRERSIVLTFVFGKLFLRAASSSSWRIPADIVSGYDERRISRAHMLRLSPRPRLV